MATAIGSSNPPAAAPLAWSPTAVDDLVVQLADFSRGALQVLFLNAGKIDIKGFESELTVAPARGLTFSANVGYIHIRYVELPANSPLLITMSCSVTPPTFPVCQVPVAQVGLGRRRHYVRPVPGGEINFSVNHA